MANFEELKNSVIDADVEKVEQLTQQAIDGGSDPIEIINNGLIAGMTVVGQRFKDGDMFVPEVLMAAKAMAAGVDKVKPLIAEADVPSSGKVVLGTVKGDLHDIGKNLVKMMLESVGYYVVDIGIDVPAEDFVQAVKDEKPQIVGMSALLTTTMMEMKETIDALKEAGVRDDVKIIVGGAPVTEEFAEEIGADAYAPDAPTATDIIEEL
ncbi:corrinoid protein [Natranaerofaba carboxydovora]|uniref:corrinoid protein n=1 Tax=Natranaerofaba carboxydovora TaxID=2742683 RepID=UPI001F137DDA|nr:corrinoid protein [Natranaerofaba carboxydovora]UMZ73831.1 Methionine synthase [Natranaerofaba carboxydovora]